ncbi:uncharacterized protein BDZ99DRAFT_568818 [Mytilinidion resinicola]|uniref:Calponin-homology (CH) domain-containing protein n=1 Tax=Mytilinidion resinicola TaxID=574789 RepID=A0A6A6YVY5_9PEZI|nr:uncharacterized protein BDZ99DRAFT_568818 [Mytilinidion resinicola]KAF2812067.1 hypothetical protein BDZ99DRAFT_568818 [Mytilinidion resinicola]
MASVSSLDQDMRRLRMSRYTPQAANEVRTWIEDILGERLPAGDLLEALKDGTALCKLVNLAVPSPGIRFKKSPMPFIQMENISHFLRACELPPLNMPSHDRFLTVDLFESKDPAQVLQCLGAFSRVANSINPSRFPSAIGPKRANQMSPTTTGATTTGGFNTSTYGRGRGASNTSTTSGSTTFNPISRQAPPPSADRALSPVLTGGSASSRATDGATKSPQGPMSSWSKKTDEGVTAPAWNIHQYGYMGGASQGNQGISFGGRRQITTAGPHVPSLAEKERKRREQAAEDERLRQLAEEAESKRRIEREAEEERARRDEEQRWEEESRRQREDEKRRVEAQKREWEEQERQWKQDEEQRVREEKEAQDRVAKETQRKRALSDARLKGTFADQPGKPRSRRNSHADRERDRIQDLERQLEEAKERERQYQLEREERHRDEAPSKTSARSRSKSKSRQPSAPTPQPPGAFGDGASEVSWAGDEREYLRQQWSEHKTPRPLPDPVSAAAPSLPTRPLPEPSSRPLPDPSNYALPKPAPASRTDRFLASNPPPLAAKPASHFPSEMGLTSTSERAAEDARRAAAQTKTKAGGWASKSLLEREMERERERQKEWEEQQRAAAAAPRDTTQGTGEGQSWDVNQYGYLGGDSQNRGGEGIRFGGRRQIIGPRPLGGKH